MSEPRILASDRPLEGELVGILAGWGRYPVVVAEEIRRRGGRTAILAIRDHADAALEPLADVHGHVGVAEIGAAVDFFRHAGARRATMAGKIHKSKIFARGAWTRHLPDWTGLATFWPHFVSRCRDNRDDSLLGAIAATFDAAGVTICPATVFGWRLAKELGRLDIGQTVVVKNRAPLALEAIEGTDECIRRAGRLCPTGGMTVVKVAKPQQDLRFDMPTIGVGTLESLAAAGAVVLAIEAGQTILIDEPEVAAAASRLGLSVVSCHDAGGVPLVEGLTAAA